MKIRFNFSEIKKALTSKVFLSISFLYCISRIWGPTLTKEWSYPYQIAQFVISFFLGSLIGFIGNIVMLFQDQKLSFFGIFILDMSLKILYDNIEKQEESMIQFVLSNLIQITMYLMLQQFYTLLYQIFSKVLFQLEIILQLLFQVVLRVMLMLIIYGLKKNPYMLWSVRFSVFAFFIVSMRVIIEHFRKTNYALMEKDEIFSIIRYKKALYYSLLLSLLRGLNLANSFFTTYKLSYQDIAEIIYFKRYSKLFMRIFVFTIRLRKIKHIILILAACVLIYSMISIYDFYTRLAQGYILLSISGFIVFYKLFAYNKYPKLLKQFGLKNEFYIMNIILTITQELKFGKFFRYLAYRIFNYVFQPIYVYNFIIEQKKLDIIVNLLGVVSVLYFAWDIIFSNAKVEKEQEQLNENELAYRSITV